MTCAILLICTPSLSLFIYVYRIIIQSYNPPIFFTFYIPKGIFNKYISYKTLERNFAKRKKHQRCSYWSFREKSNKLNFLDHHQYKYCVTVRTTFKSNLYAFCNKDSKLFRETFIFFAINYLHFYELLKNNLKLLFH